MSMNPIDIGGIVVALIAAAGAWASQRSAANANKFNSSMTARLDAEKEAYLRARAFDIETITRQNEQIHALQTENTKQKEEIRTLGVKLRRLEEGFPNILEGLLRERLEEGNDPE